MLILDGVVLIVLLLMGYLGYRKGLINMIFSIIALLVAMVISLLFFRPLSNFLIEKTTIDDRIHSIVIEKLSDKSDEEIKENYFNIIDDTKEKAKEGITEQVAQQVVTISIEVISLLVIFIVTRIILIFIKQIANAVASLPLIKQFNRLGGGIAGVLKGIIFIYIIFAIMFVMSNMVEFDIFNDLVNKSIIAKFMYDKNIFFII